MSSAFEATKQHFFVLAGLLLTFIFISAMMGIINQLGKNNVVLLSVVTVLNMLIQLFFNLGMIRILLKIADNERYDFSDIFRTFPLFLKFLGATILLGLGIAGIFTLLFFTIFAGKMPASTFHGLLGVLIVAIPVIVLYLRFYFYSYFIVDREAGIMESITESFRITKEQTGQLVLLMLALLGLNILGVLALGIGLLFTIPMSMLALTFVYRALLETADEASTGEEEE